MKLTIRPTTKAERLYFYRNSQQIFMQTGFIGYLRADIESDGKSFFSSWEDFNTDLKTHEFKEEFDEIINDFRFDEQYGTFLKNRVAMGKYCYEHIEAGFDGNYTKEYGFRVDTEKYSYLMRLNPEKGDYNLYCYCFVTERLNKHLKNATKGIRFIDSCYNELFRIQDGDKIKLVYAKGSESVKVCRYIDECHVQIGHLDTIYHICEFAEKMESTGTKYFPEEK